MTAHSTTKYLEVARCDGTPKLARHGKLVLGGRQKTLEKTCALYILRTGAGGHASGSTKYVSEDSRIARGT